jgi:hypothetical protein
MAWVEQSVALPKSGSSLAVVTIAITVEKLIR